MVPPELTSWHSLSGLFALIISSVSARGVEASEDIVDCSTTVDRFEVVLCSNHGAFDLLNHIHHIHQMLAFAPDVKRLSLLRASRAADCARYGTARRNN